MFSITVNGKTISSNSFIMPDSDVEIIVKFIKVSTNESEGESSKGNTSKENSKNNSTTQSKDESKAQDNSQTEKKYTITSSIIGNGKIELDRKTATKGTRILVTVIPDDGFKLEYIEFNGSKITEIGEKYAFTMPAKNVTVKASFIKIDDNSESSDESDNNSIVNSIPDESIIAPPSSDESFDESIDEEQSETSMDEDISINVSINDESLDNTDVSAAEENPSSPLLFIVPIIIALGMIGSIATYFIRKSGNNY